MNGYGFHNDVIYELELYFKLASPHSHFYLT